MGNMKMPATVLENIKGQDLPADLQKKLNMQPNRLYTLKAQPQDEYISFLRAIKITQQNAKKRGVTDEMVADALGVDSIL